MSKNKWKIEDPVIYSNSSGETVASAFQKQIIIDEKQMERINRLRTHDAEQLNDVDVVAYQLKVDTNNNLLKIRNADNNGWITIGAINKDYLGFIPDTIGAVKNNDGTVPGIGAKDISGAPSNSQGADGDILLDKTNKRIYQKINGTWQLYASHKASDLVDYATLVLQDQLSKKAKANKIPVMNDDGKLDVDITGTADSIGGVKIDSATKKEGGALVYRSRANDGHGGYVHEEVGPSSLIDDTKASISKSYSSDKVSKMINSIEAESILYTVGDDYNFADKTGEELNKKGFFITYIFDMEKIKKAKIPTNATGILINRPYGVHTKLEFWDNAGQRFYKDLDRSKTASSDDNPWYQVITNTNRDQLIEGRLIVKGQLHSNFGISTSSKIWIGTDKIEDNSSCVANTEWLNNHYTKGVDGITGTTTLNGLFSRYGLFNMDELTTRQLANKGMYKFYCPDNTIDKYVKGVSYASTILGWADGDGNNPNVADCWQLAFDHNYGLSDNKPSWKMRMRHVTDRWAKVKDVPWITLASEAMVEERVAALMKELESRKGKSQLGPTGYKVFDDGFIAQWGNDLSKIPITCPNKIIYIKIYVPHKNDTTVYFYYKNINNLNPVVVRGQDISRYLNYMEYYYEILGY